MYIHVSINQCITVRKSADAWFVWHRKNLTTGAPPLKMFEKQDIIPTKHSLFKKIKGLNEAILRSCNTQA
jgi:hypothetical protein